MLDDLGWKTVAVIGDRVHQQVIAHELNGVSVIAPCLKPRAGSVRSISMSWSRVCHDSSTLNTWADCSTMTKTSLGERLLILRLKVFELARLQMLPRTLALDAVRQTVKTRFHKDEVPVLLIH